MEKYGGFNDSLTGINPYLREIRKEYKLVHFLTTSLLFALLSSSYSFFYRLYTNKFVYFNKNVLSVKKLEEKRKKVFACTSTSVLDSLVLYKIFKTPKLFMVTPSKIYEVSKYNVYQESTKEEIEKTKKEKKQTLILFLSGGYTNDKILLNTEEEGKKYNVDHFLSIKYIQSTVYDINLFNVQVLPPFPTTLSSWIYLWFFYLTLRSTPEVEIFAGDTLHDLSKKIRTEISEELDMHTTEKFLKLFSPDK